MSSKVRGPTSMEVFDFVLEKLEEEGLDILDAHKIRKEQIRYQVLQDPQSFRKRIRNGFRALFNEQHGGSGG